MKRQEQQLLNLLIENKYHYITSQKIAKILEFSERTIRNQIKELKILVRKNGGEIISKQGHGIQLFIVNEFAFNCFLNKNSIPKIIVEKGTDIDGTLDRQNYILNKLLLEEKQLLVDELSDKLFVSRSTLSKDISVIKDLLERYRLSIISKPNKGIYVVGDEKDKRHFIINYFFGNNYLYSIQKYVGGSTFFDQISFAEITIVILDECRDANLKLSDFIIQNLVIHIALSIQRIKSGFLLADLEIPSSVETSTEYLVAKRITCRLQKKFQVNLPEQEIRYLGLHLVAKAISNEGLLLKSNGSASLKKELCTVLNMIGKDLGYPLADDQQLMNGILTHLYPLQIRLEKGFSIENPLMTSIQNDYCKTFEITKKYLKQISILEQYNVSDDEWAYLTLHMIAAIEKQKDKKKIQVLIICATGVGSAQLLKNRIVKELGKHISIVDVIGYYEIDNEKLRNVDLIVSALDLSQIIFNVPVIHVSVFLKEEDIKKIREYLDHLPMKSTKFKLEKNQNLSQSRKKEIVCNLIRQDYFTIVQKSIDKDTLISQQLKMLSKGEDEKYIELMRHSLKEREYLSFITFSNTIAVPHPVKSIGQEAKVSVALIPSGLYWSEEFSNIKFVFLVSPSFAKDNGIKILTDAIVSLVDNPDMQKRMIEANCFEVFQQLFIKLI